MKPGLKATFHFLAKSKNEAAVDLLIDGIDSPHRGVRDRALRALLTRPSSRGHAEIFRRLPNLDERCRSIIGERPEKLLEAAREALATTDEAALAVTLKAILTFRLYDTIPELATLLESDERRRADLAARAILKLTQSFYHELGKDAGVSKRGERANLRYRVTAALEKAVGRFRHHGRREMIEAFLLVAQQENVGLRQLVWQPDDDCRRVLVDILASSSLGGVIRLILSFLKTADVPPLIRETLATRSDGKFVKHFLRQVGPRPSRTVSETLKQLDSLTWAEPGHELFDTLTGSAQHHAVELVMATSMNRRKQFAVIRFLLLHGKLAGRRAAAARLADFDSPEAADLVVEGLADQDPVVLAHLIGQHRLRKIPGSMPRLISLVESPHQEVRDALRRALPEFTYKQFLANMESLPSELVNTAAHLVRKIDSDVRSKLEADFKSGSPVCRRRATVAAGAMGLARSMEELIIQRLSDENHLVRFEAAKVLAECDTLPTWDALRDALYDRSAMVQEAAEESLDRISRSLRVEVEEPAEETAS